MKNIDAVGGFDKELELKLLKQGYKFEYRDDAICYDEKWSQASIQKSKDQMDIGSSHLI
jgi:hypothetical protein